MVDRYFVREHVDSGSGVLVSLQFLNSVNGGEGEKSNQWQRCFEGVANTVWQCPVGRYKFLLESDFFVGEIVKQVRVDILECEDFIAAVCDVLKLETTVIQSFGDIIRHGSERKGICGIFVQ